MTSVDEFVRVYSQALADQNAALLAGAGLSIPAGMVDWKALMRSVARDIGLDVERETDLVSLAQFHVNERGGRHRINQTLVNEFSSRARLTENHEILARLPIGTYWTTNYDHLLEEALTTAGRRADAKLTAGSLAVTLPRREAVIYKMHGDVSDPSNAVVTKDDYERYATSARGQLFSTALRGDLVSKTFLFLGFSFNDPNVEYILARIRVLLDEQRRDHFCLMRGVQRTDFKSRRDFVYAQTREELQIRDLRRYGVHAVVLNDFAEYTAALRTLERHFRTRQVFVSGSANTYSPLTEPQAHRLLALLGKRLARMGMNVVTGFGLGVGPHIINGVLDQLEADGTRSINDRLIMRPFPYAIARSDARTARWTSYRREMISQAGLAVFVFGNKADEVGKTVAADGMMEEFEIARRMGLLVVPVGSTGYVADRLHRIVAADFGRYYPNTRGLKTAFGELGKSGTPDEIVNRTSKFISLLTGLP